MGLPGWELMRAVSYLAAVALCLAACKSGDDADTNLSTLPADENETAEQNQEAADGAAGSLRASDREVAGVPTLQGYEVDAVADDVAVQDVVADYDAVTDFYASALPTHQRRDFRDGTYFQGPDGSGEVYITRTGDQDRQRVTITAGTDSTVNPADGVRENAGSGTANGDESGAPTPRELGGPLHPPTTPGGIPLTMEQRRARTPDRSTQVRGTPVPDDIPPTWE